MKKRINRRDAEKLLTAKYAKLRKVLFINKNFVLLCVLCVKKYLFNSAFSAPLRLKKSFLFLIFSPFLFACAPSSGDYQGYLQNRSGGRSTPSAIRHCHDYGCQKISTVALSNREWKKIIGLFAKKPRDAAAERKKIAQAVGLFERLVAPKDGTQGDVRGTFREIGGGQLDCVDESTNTTTYLSLLQEAGLLRFHALQAPTARLPVIHAGRWPHQTAVILEKKTGIFYAVDSWFHDNGAPAEIVDLKTWKSGWKPESVRDFL